MVSLTATEEHIQALSTLLQLEKKARHAQSVKELSFVFVNEPYKLISYRQALYWRLSPSGSISIESASGVDRPDQHAPYTDYLKRLIKFLLRKKEHCHDVHALSVTDMDDAFKEEWQEWDLGFLLWVPLLSAAGKMQGGLLFIREREWHGNEVALVERLADCFGHALFSLAGRRRFFSALMGRPALRVLQIGLLLAVVAVLKLPVNLSALAPFEIVPQTPHVVSSPYNGVIQTFHVEPNQHVRQGQLLFDLDDTVARNSHEVSEKALRVLEEEARRVKQKAFLDETSRSRILEIETRIKQQQAEVEYRKELLSRLFVHAEKEGTAIFANPNDWLGKPVAVGEKILVIADPQQVEAEIRLAADDAIELEVGADVRLFFSISPDKPVRAKVRQTSYEAMLTREGVLAFYLRAELDKEQEQKIPRIGLRGTAKIHGEKVSVFYYIMRRPLAALRRIAGW